MLLDLLDVAARTLKVGGHLVYLLPTTYEFSDADVPAHPMLALVANCEQPLSTKHARRLIAMVKTRAYDADAAAASRRAATESGAAAKPYAALRERLALGDVPVVMQKKKRARDRQAAAPPPPAATGAPEAADGAAPVPEPATRPPTPPPDAAAGVS